MRSSRFPECASLYAAIREKAEKKRMECREEAVARIPCGSGHMRYCFGRFGNEKGL